MRFMTWLLKKRNWTFSTLFWGHIPHFLPDGEVSNASSTPRQSTRIHLQCLPHLQDSFWDPEFMMMWNEPRRWKMSWCFAEIQGSYSADLARSDGSVISVVRHWRRPWWGSIACHWVRQWHWQLGRASRRREERKKELSTDLSVGILFDPRELTHSNDFSLAWENRSLAWDTVVYFLGFWGLIVRVVEVLPGNKCDVLIPSLLQSIAGHYRLRLYACTCHLKRTAFWISWAMSTGSIMRNKLTAGFVQFGILVDPKRCVDWMASGDQHTGALLNRLFLRWYSLHH